MPRRISWLGSLLVLAGLALIGFAVFEFAQGLNPGPPENPITLVTAVAPTAPLATVPSVPTAPPTIPAEDLARAATVLARPTAAASTPAPLASTPVSPAAVPTLGVIPTFAPPPGAAVGTLPKPVHLVIPAIKVDAPVVDMGWQDVLQNGVSVSEWVVPQSSVGHAINSANPGERGNVVMSGHNNLYAAVFKKLYTLKVGDEITVLNASGQGFLYRVVQSYIVPEAGASTAQQIANGSVMLPTTDARLTLTSCWPEWSNTHRVIVIAQLLASQPK